MADEDVFFHGADVEQRDLGGLGLPHGVGLGRVGVLAERCLLFGVGGDLRITSYNVCYTKLLRA